MYLEQQEGKFVRLQNRGQRVIYNKAGKLGWGHFMEGFNNQMKNVIFYPQGLKASLLNGIARSALY